VVIDDLEHLPTSQRVRVVLLDADDRLLMLRIHDEGATRGVNPIVADFWLLVGGGVEAGETHEDAARREVFEETGIRDVEIGPWLWKREKVITMTWAGDAVTRVVERFYLGRVPSSADVTFAHQTALESKTITGYRWWTVAEVLDREADELFLPPGLGGLLSDLTTGVMPATPVHIQ
jgi:8-oxo-dGTP pyrophosphatase MutT (NUDIX family)